jgi:hypothetical protein
LPIIGVRRVIVQCRAHDDDRAPPAVDLGPEIPMASAFQPAPPEQGVFSGGPGCRIRGLLARNPCAIGIQPLHSRVDSCGLPPSAIRRTATSRRGQAVRPHLVSLAMPPHGRLTGGDPNPLLLLGTTAYDPCGPVDERGADRVASVVEALAGAIEFQQLRPLGVPRL